MTTLAERKAKERQIVFQKTGGICHFCGDRLEFEKYDLRDENEPGDWNYDHVNQKGKGGPKDIKNCLPAHATCNRIRWDYKGEKLRELIQLGIMVDGEIRRGTALGKQLNDMRIKRRERTLKRRKPKQEAIIDGIEKLTES